MRAATRLEQLQALEAAANCPRPDRVSVPWRPRLGVHAEPRGTGRRDRRTWCRSWRRWSPPWRACCGGIGWSSQCRFVVTLRAGGSVRGETFHPEIWLSALDPVSGFIALKQYAVDRTARTCTQALAGAGGGLPISNRAGPAGHRLSDRQLAALTAADNFISE